ncbi:MAG: Unknown protein [uncultured Aureispira sp.]|uniref:DUF4252 domain-containing protein n=1 Tax=uncultured Aureispira sp. TaxID=1331704 RepID=A0A6S6T7W3_9BACT|nr:MAG: Unknown protein [uncultured Aureispira sp.]
MKTLSVLLLLFISTMSFAQAVAKPNTALLDAAIEQYLKEMKTSFKIVPSEFIIEVADKSIYQNVQKKVGSSTIITKTKKELQDYSLQKKGKSVGFFILEVEKMGDKYVVDIMDDAIKSNGGAFSYDSIGAGRACELTFSANFKFETIDCLLLPSDPQ